MTHLYISFTSILSEFFPDRMYLSHARQMGVWLMLFFTGATTGSLQAQIGMNAHYVYGPKKEAFGGRISFGRRDVYRINAGYEQGKFNSLPTDRLLNYYSVHLGGDISIFSAKMQENESFFSFLDPYVGLDIEYLQPTRIIEDYRVSFFPRGGIRLFNALFIECIADDLNQPNKEGRFFKFNINSYRILLGFEFIFGSSDY